MSQENGKLTSCRACSKNFISYGWYYCDRCDDKMVEYELQAAKEQHEFEMEQLDREDIRDNTTH